MKNKKQFVLAITGPAGSGKSTVANLLANQINKCVNIDADHVKHMVSNPFIYDDSIEGVKQWELLGDNIGALATNFINSGYSVIINGYINEPAWHNIQSHIVLTHKVLLLPNIDVVVNRDSLRPADSFMGKEAVKEHHDYFSSSHYFNDFTKIDSSTHSEQQTAEYIKDKVI